MRYTFIIALSGLLLTACRTTESAMRRDLVGTWTMDFPMDVVTPSATDPVSFTYTFSSDGSFSERLGHRSTPVTYEGTWQIQGREVVLTVTHAEGTGRHRAVLSEIGKVDHWQVIQLDEHRFVYTVEGSTNSFTR